jgi:hypothetical protein
MARRLERAALIPAFSRRSTGGRDAPLYGRRDARRYGRIVTLEPVRMASRVAKVRAMLWRDWA